MPDNTELISRINSMYGKLSKGQKTIAKYMMQKYDKAAFMTAGKLGEEAGVSESTVVRFAGTLGYEGYPELQKALQDMVRGKLTSLQRMQITADLSLEQVLEKVMKSDVMNLKLTIGQLDSEVFKNAVGDILSARNVYVIGLRASAYLAEFLGYYLSFIMPDVRMVPSEVFDVYGRLYRIGEGDVLIAISFPRYSNSTVNAVKFAKGRKAKIISITDSLMSPISEFATHCLLTYSNMASFVDSLVAPMSLINALIVAIGLSRKTETEEALSGLEQIWHNNNVYMEKDAEIQPDVRP